MAYRRIHGKGGYSREEKVANTTITPGMLVELMSTGKVKPHATEGGRAEKLVAEEDALQGKTVSDNYSADDIVTMAIAEIGSEWAMLIASGETVSVGEKLISAGDGTLKCFDNASSPSQVEEPIAVALEASDGALSADTLMLVRFI